MDGSDSIGVYGEAKAEYTRQLCIFLVPALEGYYLDLLKETKDTEKDPRRVLWVFQDALKQFPDWNVDKVQRETEKVVTATKCDYMEEILTAVFIAHTKVLSAIRLTSRQKKLQITIPKLEHFLHRTMSECARLLWSNAYLFAENGTSIDRQKNLRQVEQLLHEGVLQSIRGMLPVKSILKEYLTDDTDDILEAATPSAVAEAEAEADADAELNAVPPVVHEENVVAPVVDLSGATVAPEPVPAPTPAAVPEPVPEPVSAPAPAPAVPEPTPAVIPIPTPVPEPVVPAASPMTSVPLIIVETESPVVGFTQRDTVFDSENSEKNTIRMSPHEDDDDDDAYAGGIEIDESAPAMDIDDFENLNEVDEDENVAFENDEFETL
jgi:hypothetical protein